MDMGKVRGVALVEGPFSAEMLEALTQVHAAAFGSEAWSLGQIEGSLALASTCCWVASAGERVLGFLLLQVMETEAEILTFCVHPDSRRKGWGGALLRRACEAFPAHELFLEVAADNQAARDLYMRLGFALVGKRPNYYHHRGDSPVDALCYRLKR